MKTISRGLQRLEDMSQAWSIMSQMFNSPIGVGNARHTGHRSADFLRSWLHVRDISAVRDGRFTVASVQREPEI